MIENTA